MGRVSCSLGRKYYISLTKSTGGRRIYLPEGRIFLFLTKSGDKSEKGRRKDGKVSEEISFV
jgi:Mor family transcriptional regulator